MDRAPEKPRNGESCNGCGFCCAAERCQAAVISLGEGPGPCPLMIFHSGRFWCLLVETEREAGMDPLIANALGIGSGCTVEDFEKERAAESC